MRTRNTKAPNIPQQLDQNPNNSADFIASQPKMGYTVY
jgi:hypothetical protein